MIKALRSAAQEFRRARRETKAVVPRSRVEVGDDNAIIELSLDEHPMLKAAAPFMPQASQDRVFEVIAKSQADALPIRKAEASDFSPSGEESDVSGGDSDSASGVFASLIGQTSTQVANIVRYPIDPSVLLASTVMNPYHSRAIRAKVTAVVGRGYDCKHPEKIAEILPDSAIQAFETDCETFGNGYFEIERNLGGEVIRLHHIRANSLFRLVNGRDWVQVIVPFPGTAPTANGALQIQTRVIPHDRIAHLYDYSPLSDYYGVPAWVSCLLHIMLAWEADDFRRKFYANGAHAGAVVLLKGIKSLSEDQKKTIRSKFQQSKGAGNFKTIFIATKDSDAEVSIIGVAKESPVRDDYSDIKQSTRENVITAHGLPPRLMSIILDAKSGAMAGQVEDEMGLFNLNTVEPRQVRLERFLAPFLPEPIEFKPFLLSRSDPKVPVTEPPPLDPENELDDQEEEVPK